MKIFSFIFIRMRGQISYLDEHSDIYTDSDTDRELDTDMEKIQTLAQIQT